MAEKSWKPQSGREGGEGSEGQQANLESPERRLVRKQLQDRRDVASHLFVFIVVNGAVIAIWAVTGGGYFWPAWIIGVWGIGLVMHAWDVFIRRPVTEQDVDEALRKRLNGQR